MVCHFNFSNLRLVFLVRFFLLKDLNFDRDQESVDTYFGVCIFKFRKNYEVGFGMFLLHLNACK